MSAHRCFLAVLVLAALAAPPALQAQGVTTGAIVGTVADETGAPVEGAQVQVQHQATGVSRGSLTDASGRFTVLGLEAGGPYTATVRRIGFAPQAQENLRVNLSQTTRLDFRLAKQAAVLSAVKVTGGATPLIAPSRTGVTTSISDSALRRLPTLNRNFTDFVALTPQISTTLQNGGLSGGGVNNRFNSIQIDGATETDLFGLGSTGQPGGQANGKSIGIESVKEYQVQLSPFDVRQGNFAGVLINAVTKSGTNRLQGSVYGFTRNEAFTRDQPYINEFNQTQYGFSLGGPVIKNQAHFFVNPEFQAFAEPALGPTLGSGTTLSEASVTRFQQLLDGYGIPSGSAGAVTNRNPLANVFARLDFSLPFNSQLVVRHNFGQAKRDIFSRRTGGSAPNFPLTSNAHEFKSLKNASVAQLRTNFQGGAFNELIVNLTTIRDRRAPAVAAPQISAVVPGATLIAGSERFSHANELDQDEFEVTDNFTYPLGEHRLTFGTRNTFYKVRNLFAQSKFGVWSFGTLDSLELGRPNQYIVGVPVTGDGAVRFTASQHSFYVQDQWTFNPRLNFTAGFRLDIPVFHDRPPHNELFASQFGGRSTRDVPTGNIQYSPRLGFNWNVTGDDRNQLRGGAGVFVGHPAFVWLSNAFQNSGLSGVALLTCQRLVAPQLTAATAASPPGACSDGRTAQAGSEINLLSEDLRFPQMFRASLGYDRAIGANWVATFEGLYTDAMYAPFYENIALAGPQGTDRYGRVMYGPAPFQPVLRVATRNVVVDVTNQSKDWSYNLTAGLQRRFANNYEGSLHYTYSQARDVQSLSSSTAFSNYRFGRAWAGVQSSTDVTRSRFEQRHRVIAHGTYSFPTQTDVSLIYTGQSGSPYDYVYNGDLNGDGFSSNDPIYVPRSAFDTAQVRFFGTAAEITAQQQALEGFIADTKCLREQRGQIMGRNTCTNPWQNLVNLSVRQSLPALRAQNVSLQVDVFNFLNLLNEDWGEQRSAGFGSIDLLRYRSKTAGNLNGTPAASPIYSFDTEQTRYDGRNIESNYQLQVSLRYSF